jgi:hypothetical protein
MMVTPFLCSAADLQLIRAEHLPNGPYSCCRAHRQYNEARSTWNWGVRENFAILVLVNSIYTGFNVLIL